MFRRKPNQRFGWIKDKYDPRDYLFTPRLPKAEIPKVVDLRPYLPAVRDQGDEGSCVGFGVGMAFTIKAKMLGVDPEWFSPRWFYNGAREIEGRMAYAGAYPRDAFEFGLKHGCLKEHYWPYVAHPEDNVWKPDSDEHIPPTKHASYPHGKEWLLAKYDRAVDGLDGILGALAQLEPVPIGSPWYNHWMKPGSDGVLGKVSATNYVKGGHETCLCGYDLDKQLLYGVNSWSEAWGDKGRYYMPFQAIDRFKQDGGYDAHVITVSWVGNPLPAVEYVELFVQREGQPEKSFGKNSIADAIDGKYRWRSDPNSTAAPVVMPKGILVGRLYAGNHTAHADIKLAGVSKIFLGSVRKFKVVEAPQPPPPPPPEPSATSEVEYPAEGQELDVSKEHVFVVSVKVSA